MNEINEDSCILDECDYDLLDVAFKDYLKACSNAGKEYLVKEVAKVMAKINKLNEIVKDQKNKEQDIRS